MFVVIQSSDRRDDVINVIYDDDEACVKNWISEYLVNEMESWLMCPVMKDMRNVSFTVEDRGNCSALIKKYKRILRGYVYNSSEIKQEEIFSVKYLAFDGNSSMTHTSESHHQNDITKEINKRVLRQLDKPSLFNVFTNMQSLIDSKSMWNSEEFAQIVSESIKKFKKELYNSISKKMKRSVYKNSLIPKNIQVSMGQ
jgi:hypothetical protein